MSLSVIMPGSMRRWLAVAALAAAWVGGTTFLSTPAFAAPGEVTAVGFDADFAGELENGTPFTVTDKRGPVAAPPDASAELTGDETLISVDLGAPIGIAPVAQAATISTSATSSATRADATASVTTIELFTPAGVIAIDGVSSSVSCPLNGAPTGTATGPTSVTLNGAEVSFMNGVAVIEYDGDQPPGTATITLTVAPPVLTGTTATGTGLLYELVEDLDGLLTAQGDMAIGRTSCETPAQPPTLTTSGVLRESETGAPIRGCVLLSSLGNPGQSQLVWTNGDGTWAYTGNTPGPFALAFFTAANGDCNQTILTSPVPSWYRNQPLSGTNQNSLVPPPEAAPVTAGTTGVVACLGATALPTAACVEPTVVMSGQVLTPDPDGGVPAGVAQACVVLLRDVENSDPLVGFAIADAEGRWEARNLPVDTAIVIGAIPQFSGPDGPCSSEGPPPVPPAGGLQPEFYQNTWINLADPTLLADPFGWAIEHGAEAITNSATGLDVCLTTDPGTVDPRPGCEPPPPPTTPSSTTPSLTTPSSITPTSVTSVITSTVVVTTGDQYPELSATGAPWTTWMATGLVLIAAGSLMIRASRRWSPAEHR